jgi:hypothetical protein
MSTITYNLEITNNQVVTPIYYTNTITPNAKIERKMADMTVLDSAIDVSVTKLGTLQTVFANATDANLAFYTVSGVVNTVRVGGQMMWELPASLGIGIINCRVSANGASPQDIDLTLIGV